MTIKQAKFGYQGVIPDYTFGKTTGVYTLQEHITSLKRLGLSGAALGYNDGDITDFDAFTWLAAGETKTITGFPYIIIYLPPAASGAISSYVTYTPFGNFSGQNTYTITGNDTFVFSQNIAGSYNNSEWGLFSISTSTDYFAPQYALLAGKFTRFSTNGGTISLV